VKCSKSPTKYLVRDFHILHLGRVGWTNAQLCCSTKCTKVCLHAGILRSRTFTHLLQTIWQFYCRFQTKHENTIVFPYCTLSFLFLTFRGPCIVIHSSNKNRDALFLKFIICKESYIFRTDLLSIISSLNTVYPAIGICHAWLLARSGWNLMKWIMTSAITVVAFPLSLSLSDFMFRADLLSNIRSHNIV